MKKIFLLLILCSTAWGTKVTLTGTITDGQGNPLNGVLVMQLPVPAQDTTTNTAVMNAPVYFNVVNGSVVGSAQLYDVASLQPQGLYYAAAAYDRTGHKVLGGNYYVTGASFNLGAAVPTNITTSNVSYAGLCLTGVGAAPCQFAGPTPWYDVSSPAYNARCDGVTDDTAAFNAAFAAANGTGGRVFVPTTPTGVCVIAGQLNLDQLTGINIVAFGYNGVTGIGANVKPILKFTGNPSTALILMRSTKGIKWEGLTIQYTNASFTGYVFDLEHTGTGCGGGGCDTEQDAFRDMLIEGTSTANGATAANLDKTFMVKFDNVFFGWLANGINGEPAGGTYSGKAIIDKCAFGTSGTPISGTAILNAGQNWTISNNFFEIFSGSIGPGTMVIFDGTTSVPQSTSFTANTIGDTPAGYVGPMIKGIGSGFTMTGGKADGVSTASFLSAQSGATGLTVNGVAISTFGTAFTFNSSNQANVNIFSNVYASITNFRSGFPLSGKIEDTGGQLHVMQGNFLNKQGSTGTLTGNSSDQTVYTFSLPADTVWPGRGIRVTVDYIHVTGTASTAYKLNFNGTAVPTQTYAVATANTANEKWVIEFYNNAGVQNAQTQRRLFSLCQTGTDTCTNNRTGQSSGFGTTSIDFSTAQTIAFTFNVANTDQVQGLSFEVELIQ